MTDLTGEQHRRIVELRRALPFSSSYPGVPPTIRDVDSLLRWLDGYARHADAQAAKLRTEDEARARAVTVLRGLRQNLANAVDTIGELDDAIDAGVIEVSRPRLTPVPRPLVSEVYGPDNRQE